MSDLGLFPRLTRLPCDSLACLSRFQYNQAMGEAETLLESQVVQKGRPGADPVRLEWLSIG